LGISGATVTLTDCNGNPVTDSDGNPVAPITTASTGAYLFINLKPGQYTVTFTLPDGYRFTQPYQGSDTAKDSNANPATGKSECVILAAGENNRTIDAGAYKPLPWETGSGMMPTPTASRIPASWASRARRSP